MNTVQVAHFGKFIDVPFWFIELTFFKLTSQLSSSILDIRPLWRTTILLPWRALYAESPTFNHHVCRSSSSLLGSTSNKLLKMFSSRRILTCQYLKMVRHPCKSLALENICVAYNRKLWNWKAWFQTLKTAIVDGGFTSEGATPMKACFCSRENIYWALDLQDVIYSLCALLICGYLFIGSCVCGWVRSKVSS